MLISLSYRRLSCGVQGGLAKSALVYQEGAASYFTLFLRPAQETFLDKRSEERRAAPE
jgi:hypothetical protein